MWTALQHDGANHLEFVVHMGCCFLFMWTALRHDGANHLGLWFMWTVLQHDGANHLGFVVN